MRPATANSKEAAQQPGLLPVTAAAVRPSINQPEITRKAAQITVESVADEEAGPPQRVRLLNPHARNDTMEEASPESEQQDSVLGNPVAQSTAHNAFHKNTQFQSAISVPTSENASRFSRNPQSIRRVMREHAERAEPRAQSAFEQNRAALDLISRSMDNVRNAFTEAKRTRERYHDMLSVSSRSRQIARRHADVDAPSVHQAEGEAIDAVQRVANYQRRLQSQVLSPDERQEVQPSIVSSWCLRSGMYPASLSRLVEGENVSMDLGTRVSTANFTPLEQPKPSDPMLTLGLMTDLTGDRCQIAGAIGDDLSEQSRGRREPVVAGSKFP